MATKNNGEQPVCSERNKKKEKKWKTRSFAREKISSCGLIEIQGDNKYRSVCVLSETKEDVLFKFVHTKTLFVAPLPSFLPSFAFSEPSSARPNFSLNTGTRESGWPISFSSPFFSQTTCYASEANEQILVQIDANWPESLRKDTVWRLSLLNEL